MNYKKVITLTFLLIFAAEIISLLSFYLLDYKIFINNISFLVVILATICFSLRRPHYGLYILVAELIHNSFGYLFVLQIGNIQISLRTGLFIIVMSIWFFWKLLEMVSGISRGLCCNSGHQKISTINLSYKWLAALMLVTLWGVFQGLIIQGNSFANVFLDFNNWLYFLIILPLADYYKKNVFIFKTISLIISTIIFWTALKTFIIFYVFSHAFQWTLPEFYFWVRDTGLGEITRYNGNIYRVFFQNQIFGLLLFFIFSGYALNYFFRKKRPTILLLLLSSVVLAEVIISLSRSFWLGFLCALCIYMLGSLFLIKKIIIKQYLPYFLKLISYFFVIFLGCFTLLGLIYFLPPKIKGDLSSVLDNRLKMEAAGSSRLNMLKPLLHAISDHPLIGSGFGRTVTYQSADPRIVATTAAGRGQYNTYAFEWGYLDIILKLGLLGLFVYFGFLWVLLKQFWHLCCKYLESKPKQATLYYGFFVSILALMAVNITTPFLNHPLGIGWLVILTVISSKDQTLLD